MRPSPIAVPQPPVISSRPVPQAMVSAERAYQGSTIVAMLWLLCSLWLFR